MQLINFSCVHQNKVRHYAKAKGWLAKTDKIDSKLISDYAFAFSLKVKQTYDSDNQQTLHNLIKRREQLVLSKTQELARLDKFSDIAILQSLRDHIDYLDQNLKSIETEIKNNIINLTSIPGVGIVLATNIIANVPELGNIDIRKATSLIGLAPYARESSSYKGRRTIFAGRSKIRKILYMAAIASLRCNNKLRSFYDRLISNGKPPKVALVAVMRKLLTFIQAILKNNTAWNENYVNI
jgi:transposase